MLLHGSTVALNGRALVILGPSGAGKSALALQLLALGADLLADDQTLVSLEQGVLTARCPDTISGLIEARGVGLLTAAPCGPTPVFLVVDLGQAEDHRLPPRRKLDILGQPIDLVQSCASPHFPAALIQYLKAGRAE